MIEVKHPLRKGETGRGGGGGGREKKNKKKKVGGKREK